MADNLDHRKITKEVSKDSELEKKMELVKKMLTNWKETLINEGIEGKKNTRLVQNTLTGEEFKKWMRRKLRQENFEEEEEKSMETILHMLEIIEDEEPEEIERVMESFFNSGIVTDLLDKEKVEMELMRGKIKKIKEDIEHLRVIREANKRLDEEKERNEVLDNMEKC